ncbi:MAG: trypsin-like peptidase domain-containing protein [Gammaproteobacteria bacterium]
MVKIRHCLAGICLAVISTGAFTAETPGWSKTLERVSSGVVSLRIDATRSFDTERNVSTQATGFIVDIEKGLILTNRHVVTPGPVRSVALFLNQEEVPLIPVYRDPVHDFGLYRFDPKVLRYIEPAELQLKPDRAAVGLEVRILGNDAGEQLSILSGTIARLDRRTPNYGYGKYNDFNTFYIQAATGSSGGSSGSPVIDISGDVVALNAGASTSAATSFFLPLDRVKRAVDLIREGKPVTRGTLETRFNQQAFDKLGRLGLTEEVEARYRKLFPEQTGMLVVNDFIRSGTADGLLQVGDVLLEINNTPLSDFASMEAILDEQVGQPVLVAVERNGERLDQEINVTDLHAITPSEFIQAGGGVFHKLSYHQAWHVNKPIEGIYVAEPGYILRTVGIPRRSVITELGGKPVKNLDDLEAVLNTLADRQDVTVRLFPLEDPGGEVLRVVRMDRRWFGVTRCKRDDDTGLWPCRELDAGPAPAAVGPASARFAKQDNRLLDKLTASLVLVNFDMPFTVSGISDRHYYGTGLVVDTERGLVVVDRNTVPEALGDVRLTFAGSVEVTGKVEFIHPQHNLALLSYDPASIGDTPVRAASFGKTDQQPADKLLAVGLRADSTVVSQSVEVASWKPAYYSLSRSMRFRESNLETLSLVTQPKDIDGVLADNGGRIVALWSSFAYESGKDTYQENQGFPVDIVTEMIDSFTNGTPLRSLEAEFRHMPLSLARNYGLPEEQVRMLEEHDQQRRQLLTVVRTVAGTPTATVLQPGDMLLTIDGQPVTRFREIEKAAQQEQVSVTVFRNDSVQTFDIETTVLDGSGVRRVLIWGGALLQPPYREMAAQRGISSEGVYIAYFSYGTPAARSGLTAGSRIVQVDGQPITDLDSFIDLVKDLKDRESVRVTTVSWNGTVQVTSLTLDLIYWPAAELIYNGDWHRVSINSAASGH